MIYIENLHKTFDTVKAVNGVTLCMETGGIFGLPGTLISKQMTVDSGKGFTPANPHMRFCEGPAL